MSEVTIPSADRPIAAVFFINGSRLTDHLLRRWRAAGHRVAGIVMPRRRHPYHWCRRLAAAKLAGTPATTVSTPIDWAFLSDWVAPLEADVLISYAFPKLVPAELLSLFPKGGVNLHPALLPHYRGPQPFQCMVADGAWRTFGGMTLHVMSDRYDEGDILATTAFAPADWRSPKVLRSAVMQTMADVAVEAVPLYCRGVIRPRPQPPGEFPYADQAPRAFTVRPEWTVNDLAAAGTVLARRAGVFVEAGGGRVRIGRWLKTLGPPTGQPPVVRPFWAEFDCRDGRVRVARADRLSRMTDQVRRRLHSESRGRESRPVRYETFTG
jgi:methionyl-tRNA formyltransferase